MCVGEFIWSFTVLRSVLGSLYVYLNKRGNEAVGVRNGKHATVPARTQALGQSGTALEGAGDGMYYTRKMLTCMSSWSEPEKPACML